MPLTICVDCGRQRRHKARGCCDACYAARCRAGDPTRKAPPPPPRKKPTWLIDARPPTLPTIEGLSYRQLDYWTTTGYLRANQRNPGTGRRRSWPDEELAVAATMLRLSTAGLTVEAAHRVARGVSELAPGVWVILADMPPNDLDHLKEIVDERTHADA